MAEFQGFVVVSVVVRYDHDFPNPLSVYASPTSLIELSTNVLGKHNILPEVVVVVGRKGVSGIRLGLIDYAI